MRTFVPACVLVVTCCSLPAAAAPQTCTPERIGGDQRGPATGLARAGTRLVLATGGAVEIVDVGDPAEPQPRGYADVGTFVTGIGQVGLLAVAAGPDGLFTVDLTDPDRPVVLGSMAFPSPAWPELALTDSAAYLAPWPGGLAVIDLGDPEAPSLAGVYPLLASDLVTYGERLYAVHGTGVTVLDISDPLAPKHVATVAPGGAGIAVSGNGQRLATWRRCDPRHDCGTVRFYNLVNPDLPIVRSSIVDGNRTPTAVSMSGGRAYVSYSPGPGDIFNLPNPASPTLVGQFDVDWGTALASTANHLFVADFYGGLDVHDVSPPSGSHRLARYETPDQAVGGFVHDGYAIGVWDDQVRVYDLGTPAGPTLVTSLPAPEDEWFSGVSAVQGVGYLVAGSPGGVRILDARSPLSPAWGDSLELDEFQPAVRLSGRRLYAWDDALRIFDLSTPTAPAPLAVWDDRQLDSIDLIGPYLFGLERVPDRPLVGLDFSDPFTPQLLFEQPGFGSSWGFVAAGSGLLMRATNEQSQLFRAFSPGGPVLTGSFATPSAGAIDGAWHGSRLHLSLNGGATTREHQVWETVDPTQPTLVLASPALDYARATFSGPGVLGLAQGMAGVEFFDSCSPFVDGFETGDLSAWSLSDP